MSLDILVEEYLGTMKEDGELDKFLPILLTAMGHVVLSSPQKGTRQSGGDLLTVGRDEDDGVKKVFVWVIKCGDIDRAAWNSGEQSVRPTLDSVVDVYLSANLSPSRQHLPKKVCIVTNGEFRQSVQQEITGYLRSYQQRYHVETEEINGSILANWAGKHMLDERVLPDALRSLMRRALANVETPDASVEHARQLVTRLIQSARGATGSRRTQQRKVTGYLRAVALFNAILFGWARQANNLESAYVTAEFTVLAAWVFVCQDEWIETAWIRPLFTQFVAHYLVVTAAYHAKLEPYYRTQGAFGIALHDSSLVAERVFEEIGRLGTASVTLTQMADVPNGQLLSVAADDFAGKLAALLQTHTVGTVPCYDRNAIDITCGMAALVMNRRADMAKVWLHGLVHRLVNALQSRLYAPLSSDSFDDLVAIRHGQLAMQDDLLHVTTLVPALAFWCYRLDCPEDYKVLREQALPRFNGATLNVWFADKNYESLLDSPERLSESGFGTSIVLPESMSDLPSGLPGATGDMLVLNDFKAFRCRLGGIAFLASRHWKLQLPHDIAYVLGSPFPGELSDRSPAS
ncbi:hypothetical protein BJG93_00780 [Paraburkholderia sprentiae WSM5005]|uniref:Uncharacterized protein n=1 Tax=Paraburkholderia sprentiae WSM5005 TaxID=754502 RepID=A0A1I9YCR4_9BURK|nr:hypothetical protein [Paraburkholderia sprentiae]APA84097.1 hypothetical protein BJG93_00780 [Paraburkholderia sprentiae WSM5005]